MKALQCIFLAAFLLIFSASAMAADIHVCQYASSATATSENTGSIASYSVGAPNAPSSGECSAWSGYGYSWNPTNWNIKANLTLIYGQPVIAENFTVYGDYDMCINRIWLKNSSTGNLQLVMNGPDTSCVLTKQLTNSFKADTIILETCGWAWASTDAVVICGISSSSASPPICGNSIKEGTEQCDNGTSNGLVCTAAYNSSCTYCSNNCAITLVTGPYCGDNTINGNEQCDDGNTINGDGCSSTCTIEINQTPVCGNSVLEAGEQCDSGISNGLVCTAAYNSSCTYCGNSCTNTTIKGPYCGDNTLNGIEECDDGNILAGDGCSPICMKETVSNSTTICQYASSATATSENTGSIASYSVGAPNSPSANECSAWGGYGYSWNPTNWNIKANLTLKYSTPVYASNFTIFGDYDMCWGRAWLKNSATGQTLQVINSPDQTCTLTKKITSSFLADTVILETCGWGWTSTDATSLCGNTGANTNTTPAQPTFNVSICTWKNCRKGAVSVSVDDYYTSCMDELEAYGYRGTYFLTNTNTYSSSFWTELNSAFQRGHELGTHTQSHICSSVGATAFIKDMETNINNITSHTSATRTDIISHAYACGYVTTSMKTALKSNWNFLSARGYYFNQLENTTPTDYFNLKSYNSYGYPGGKWDPPNYLTLLDAAEQQGKWLNMVFHNECSDDNSISSLPSRDLWVDTIGNVVKYTKIRDNARISNYQASGNEIRFNVTTNLTTQIYKQSLTLQAGVGKQPLAVKVNGQPVPFLYVSSKGYVSFDFPFPVNGEIIITT
jgi:cysteine-rich repeat protein